MAEFSHDAPYQALFERLQQKVTGIEYFTRRADHWDTVEKAPALLLEATEERALNEPDQPPRWLLGARVTVDALLADKNASPETQLHELAGRIRAALRRDVLTEGRPVSADEYGTTLGGLVYSCRVVAVDPQQGVVTGRATLYVDIEMRAVEER